MKPTFCAPEFVFTQENSTRNSSLHMHLNLNWVVWVQLREGGGRGTQSWQVLGMWLILGEQQYGGLPLCSRGSAEVCVSSTWDRPLQELPAMQRQRRRWEVLTLSNPQEECSLSLWSCNPQNQYQQLTSSLGNPE